MEKINNYFKNEGLNYECIQIIINEKGFVKVIAKCTSGFNKDTFTIWNWNDKREVLYNGIYNLKSLNACKKHLD